MAPPPCFFISSEAYRVHSELPTTFTPSERCHSSGVPSTPLRMNTAALFTSTSIFPNSRSAASPPRGATPRVIMLASHAG